MTGKVVPYQIWLYQIWWRCASPFLRNLRKYLASSLSCINPLPPGRARVNIPVGGCRGRWQRRPPSAGRRSTRERLPSAAAAAADRYGTSPPGPTNNSPEHGQTSRSATRRNGGDAYREMLRNEYLSFHNTYVNVPRCIQINTLRKYKMKC